MQSTDLQKLIDYEKQLKYAGKIKFGKDFAAYIGETPQGWADLKAGRKKVSLRHVDNMKKKQSELGDSTTKHVVNEPQSAYVTQLVEVQNKLITALEEISRLNSELDSLKGKKSI